MIADKNYLAAPLTVMIIVILALMGTTYERNAVWRNEGTLWEDVLKKNHNNSKALNNLGMFYAGKNQQGKAIELFQRATTLDPSNYKAYYNRGISYLETGQFEKAISDFDIAILLYPLYYKAYNNKGMAFANLGLLDKAIEQFNRALVINPSNSFAYNKRGLLYSVMGEYGRAIAVLLKQGGNSSMCTIG